MLQEELEVAVELVAENLEEEVKWLVGAQVGLVVLYPEAPKVTIHQCIWMGRPTIHQNLVVRWWWVATIHWR